MVGNGGGDNVLPFPHPSFGDVYRSEVKKLIAALRTNPRAIETRIAFRNLINTVVVHPTAKRMPYEFTPYISNAALSGINLFPARRTAREIVAARLSLYR